MTDDDFETGSADPATPAEERIFEACERFWRRTRRRANRACLSLDEFGGIVRRLGARVDEGRDEEGRDTGPFVTLHGPTGILRASPDLDLEPPAMFVYYKAEHLSEADLLRAPLSDLTPNELQERYECEEGAAMIAMARAQRTRAEIARRMERSS